MKQAIAAILILLLPAAAAANECQRTWGLQAGKVSPCSGILKPAAEHQAGERCVLQLLPLANKRLAAAVKTSAADAELERFRLKTCRLELLTLRDRKPLILRIEKPTPWWGSPLFWGPVSLAAGIAGGYALQRWTRQK